MNKRFLAILLCVIFIIIGGCESKNVAENTKTKEETTAMEEDAPKELVVETKTDFSKLIPNPKEYFPNTEIEIVTTDDTYTVYLDSVTPEEWNAYIEKCKTDGFWTDETYYSEYSWYIHSTDGLYGLLLDRYGDQNKYMTILVKEEEKDEK